VVQVVKAGPPYVLFERKCHIVRRETTKSYLLKSLEKRYGQVDQPSTVRKQLMSAQQDDKESLDENADKVYSLTIDGYP